MDPVREVRERPVGGYSATVKVEQMRLHAATPADITTARAMLSAAVQRWGCNRGDDALLVLSELVTNAVVHAGGAVRIDIHHRAHTMRLEVHDHAHGIPHRTTQRDIGGWGMQIVAQLAATWGWEQTATGKVVWALLDCDTSPTT